MHVAFLFFIQYINNTINTINGLFNCFHDCFSCILILENIRIHMESMIIPLFYVELDGIQVEQ